MGGDPGGKAYYVNVGSTSYTYVFKTAGSGAPGTSKVIVFSPRHGPHHQLALTAPAGTIWTSGNVVITAGISGALATGQGVYLRYSTDAWASSTITAMTCSSTTCTGTIPAAANNPSATVRYYAFSSGGRAEHCARRQRTTTPSTATTPLSYQVNPDGTIEQEYGSTRMIDLAAGKSGDQDVCEGR